jgi:hypothetical protein
MIIDGASFCDAFSTSHKRWTKPVVLFIDEFDILYHETFKEVCSSVLATFRMIRNDVSRGTTNPAYIIHSIVTVGTFSILMLNQEDDVLSPFNISENFDNVSLTKKQVEELFMEFQIEHGRNIDPAVINDIFALTNGYVKYGIQAF